MPSNEGQAARPAGEAASAKLARAVFGETSNPAEYVPRRATEEALLALERAARVGRCAALTAPPGLGKSLLLRILEQRLAPAFRSVTLPYGALESADLCAWALGLLDEPPPADGPDDARAALLRLARRQAETGCLLVLLVDDASSLPLATARDLVALVRESGNRLRLVLAAADDASSSRVISVFSPDVVEVRLHEPMTTQETRLYVETRLEQAGAPLELRSRFHEDTLAWIHRLSGGVPRRVHELGSSLLDAPPEGVGSLWSEERWLGAPLDDVDASLLGDLPPLSAILARRPPLELPETLVDEDDDIDLL